MNRRDFVKLGATASAGAFLSTRNAAGIPIVAPGAGIPQGSMVLPENPGFRTKHLVTILLGNGARKMDVVDNEAHAPFQSQIIRQGTVFTEDYGETANLHGYMYTELLTGRDAPAQRPRYPTWNEYVRKKTGAKATDFWMLQSASYYRAWTWDVKNYSRHPEYGVRYGATSLTMSRTFGREKEVSPREIAAQNVEEGLALRPRERRDLEDWIADVRGSGRYVFPSTREPVIERPLQVGDCQAIHLAGEILRTFKPRMITVQVLGLDDGHADFGFWDYPTDCEQYLRHLRTTDELIGKLWADVQADPALRDSTALIIRPECGRDAEVNVYGQLGHSSGSYDAHYVWATAVGPDFERGRVVSEQVQRRDLAPTITYLMSGENAEYATGHVRTQAFDRRYGMPEYVLPPTTEPKPPVLDWKSPSAARTERVAVRARSPEREPRAI